MRTAAWSFAVGILAVLAASGVSHADYQYRFVTDQASYQVQPGEQVTVSVFLEEVVTGGSTSRLLGDGEGLLTAGIRAVFGEGAPAQVLSVSDILPNPAFTETEPFLVTELPGDGSAILEQAVALGDDPVAGINLGGGVARVFLGSFRLTAVSIGSMLLQILDADPTFANTVTADLTALDEAPFGIASATVQIQVIPEPSSLTLVAFGALALAGGWRLRRPKRVA